MKSFDIKVARGSRIFIALINFAGSVALAFYSNQLLENILIKIMTPIFLIGMIAGLSLYYVYANLTVTLTDDKLQFKFKKKLFFNYPPINDIYIKDIRTIVIDNNSVRKIITRDQKISICSLRSDTDDALDFIEFLKMKPRARVLDSWDVIKEAGYLKIIYVINILFIVGGIGFLLYSLIIKQHFSNKTFLIFGGICQLFFHHLVIKNKIYR
jgi:hypothetical protein